MEKRRKMVDLVIDFSIQRKKKKVSSYFLSYLFYNSHWYLYLIALSLVFVLDAYLLLYFPITQSFFSLIEIVNKEEKKIIKERKRTGSNKWKEVDQHVVYGTVDQKEKWWQLPVGTAKFIVISDEGWWWVRKMKGKRKRERERDFFNASLLACLAFGKRVGWIWRRLRRNGWSRRGSSPPLMETHMAKSKWVGAELIRFRHCWDPHKRSHFCSFALLPFAFALTSTLLVCICGPASKDSIILKIRHSHMWLRQLHSDATLETM